MSEHNKTLVRRLYEEVENQLKLDVADELIAPNFRDVHNTASPFPVVGPDGIKKLATALHEFFDMHLTVEDLIAEGDKVVAHIGGHVTHKHPFMGVAPTNRQFPVNGAEIWRVVNGKLAERWVFVDQLPMMKELGIIPK